MKMFFFRRIQKTVAVPIIRERGLSPGAASANALNFCEMIFKKVGLPWGHPLDTAGWLSECADECNKLVWSDGYKENCGPCP